MKLKVSADRERCNNVLKRAVRCIRSLLFVATGALRLPAPHRLAHVPYMYRTCTPLSHA